MAKRRGSRDGEESSVESHKKRLRVEGQVERKRHGIPETESRLRGSWEPDAERDTAKMCPGSNQFDSQRDGVGILMPWANLDKFPATPGFLGELCVSSAATAIPSGKNDGETSERRENGTFEFPIVLAGMDEMTEEISNRLYEADCRDATPFSSLGVADVWGPFQPRNTRMTRKVTSRRTPNALEARSGVNSDGPIDD